MLTRLALPSRIAMADTSTETEVALRYKQPQYHYKFTLPATKDHGDLQIGYSDLGRQPDVDNNPPVILFMPGLQATRLLGDFLGIVGLKLGTRIITVDRYATPTVVYQTDLACRPGIGKSTQVPLQQRLKTWVELVPKLLAHLNIEHVSLVSHSAGTLYLLNTLYSCRELLSPTPYVALLGAAMPKTLRIHANEKGPYVDVAQSGVRLLQAAQILPSGVFGGLDTLSRTVATTVGPAIGSSISFAFSLLPSKPAPESENRTRWKTEYGVSAAVLDGDAACEAMYCETLAGMNDEARLCLRKDGSTWEACDDFEAFVKKLDEKEKDRTEKLKVRIYFAEEDSLIGEKGKQYMEKCWSEVDAIEYSSVTVPGSNHDSLVTTAAVLEEIVRDVTGVN